MALLSTLLNIVLLSLLSTNCHANIFDDIGSGFEDLGNVINDNVIQPVGDAFSDAGDAINDNVIQPVGDAIDDVLPPSAVDVLKASTYQIKQEIQAAVALTKVPDCGRISSENDGILPAQQLFNDGKILLKEFSSKMVKCYNALKDPVKSILNSMENEDFTEEQANSVMNAARSCLSFGGEMAPILAIESAASFSIGVGIEAVSGLIIDFNTRQIYGYAGGCGHAITDAQASVGIAAYLFNDFNDIAGCSKYYAVGVDIVDIFGMDGIVAFDVPTTKRIAVGMDLNAGAGINVSGFNAEMGYCYTIDPVLCGSF